MLSELLADLRYRLRALFRRAQVERELTEELAFHLEQETAKLVASGLPMAEARRRARLAFGGVERIKEESRDGRGLVLLETVKADLRYALRSLRGTPGFTAGVVVTLALGIGANTAMFGIVDRLLFRPPAYLRDPATVNRLYLASTYQGVERITAGTEYTRYLDLQRWTRTAAAIAAFADTRLAIGSGLDVREMPVHTVSAGYFEFFTATPVVGRFFTQAENTVPRGAPVAVLSYGFWQSRYGGRSDAVGQSLQIGPLVYSIIGVAPRGFVGMANREAPVAFIPITTYAASAEFLPDVSSYYTTYHWSWLELLVRRTPGTTTAEAAADFTTAYERSWQAELTEYPDLGSVAQSRPRAIAASVLPERGPNQSKLAQVAQWLAAVALIVLLIACANVANLLLARALRRRKEIALRIALGVSRTRLFGQLLTETFLLAGVGGLVGLAIGRAGTSMLWALFSSGSDEAAGSVDWRALGFAAAVTLLAALISGLIPLAQNVRADVATALKAGAREGSYQPSRLRTALLVFQGTLSVVLLVGAGLFVRSLQNVRALRLGYDVDQLLYVEAHSRGTKQTDQEKADFARRLEVAARTLPEVELTSRAGTVPFWSRWSTSLFVPGIDSVRRLGSFSLQMGSATYFATTGTRILRGRGIAEQDRKGAPGIIVVSEAMARTLWPGQDALGKCVRVDSDTLPCNTVVGIAENIKQRELSDDPGLHYYLAADQYHPESARLFIRTRGNSAQLGERIRLELQKLMPGTSYLTVLPFRDVVNPQMASWKVGAQLFLAFGGMALVVAAIGLYSVIAYNVAQRTHELGLRIALGAAVGDVLRMVVGHGVRIAAAGVVIGAGIALAASRWLEPLLFAQSARDPVVYGAVAAVLLAVATVASLLPARRAARVDPTVALRAD